MEIRGWDYAAVVLGVIKGLLGRNVCDSFMQFWMGDCKHYVLRVYIFTCSHITTLYFSVI